MTFSFLPSMAGSLPSRFSSALARLRRLAAPTGLALVTAFILPPMRPAQADARDLTTLPVVKAQAGKVVLLDFWASWCAPCRQSFPWMSALQKRYGAQNFTVVAVNMDQDRTLAAKFLEKTPADFQIVYDPKGDIATLMNVQAMPTSYLIDRTGRQRAIHKGFRDAQRAPREKEIEQLLKEMPTQ